MRPIRFRFPKEHSTAIHLKAELQTHFDNCLIALLECDRVVARYMFDQENNRFLAWKILAWKSGVVLDIPLDRVIDFSLDQLLLSPADRLAVELAIQ